MDLSKVNSQLFFYYVDMILLEAKTEYKIKQINNKLRKLKGNKRIDKSNLNKF